MNGWMDIWFVRNRCVLEGLNKMGMFKIGMNEMGMYKIGLNEMGMYEIVMY